MTRQMKGWMAGLLLVGSAVSANAMADGGPLGLYNPLGFYIGGGVGRSDLSQDQFDAYDSGFHRLDGNPVGWTAFIGVRPIPFLGAELEYIDFGYARVGAGPLLDVGGLSQQYLGGHADDRAAVVSAVGYLPVPLPFFEPFVKLGWARLRERDSFSGVYNDLFNSDGSPVGLVSGSNSNDRSGVAYGAGVQFHFEQLAVRAQYERISTSRDYGNWNNPSLLSVGLSWTF